MFSAGVELQHLRLGMFIFAWQMRSSKDLNYMKALL